MKMVRPSGCTAWEVTNWLWLNVGGGAGSDFQDQPSVFGRCSSSSSLQGVLLLLVGEAVRQGVERPADGHGDAGVA